ncbi:unnamed protein product [Camellia sinensis]
MEEIKRLPCITDLPFSLYSTFVIEARHGFNKLDMIKGIILATIIGPPIVATIIVIVQKGGPYLAIYLWGYMLVLSFVMMTVYDVLIAPLFNKLTPLPDGELCMVEKLFIHNVRMVIDTLLYLFMHVGDSKTCAENAYHTAVERWQETSRCVLLDRKLVVLQENNIGLLCNTLA